MQRIWLKFMLGAGLLLAVGHTQACITPVFRYALERWEPSLYTLVVFHRGPLTTNDQALLQALRQVSAEEQGPANLAIASADLEAKPAKELLQLWQSQTNATVPWAVLRYPESEPDAPSAWAGPLTPQTARLLVDSPVRREVSKRIAGGQAAVWILLDSGDQAQDEKAAKLIESELKNAEQTLELPADPALDQTNTIKLKVAFSLLRINRRDPAEQVFVNTLLALDQELAQMKTPVAAPIFGRGRALCALPGAQITAPVLKEALAFLVGSCSCEVKELNPGLDLLMAANWNEAVEGNRLSDPPLPALIGLGGLVEKPKAKSTNAAPVLAQTQSLPAPAGKLYHNLIYVGLGLLVAVGLMTLLVTRKK